MPYFGKVMRENLTQAAERPPTYDEAVATQAATASYAGRSVGARGAVKQCTQPPVSMEG